MEKPTKASPLDYVRTYALWKFNGDVQKVNSYIRGWQARTFN